MAYKPEESLKTAKTLAMTALSELPKDWNDLNGEQLCKSIQDLHAASEHLMTLYKEKFRG